MITEAKLAIAACLLIAAFGGGYYVATGQYERELIVAQGVAIKAQHDLDIAQAAQARAISALVLERKKKAEAHATVITGAIAALPSVVTSSCEVTPEALKLLNEAAQ